METSPAASYGDRMSRMRSKAFLLTTAVLCSLCLNTTGAAADENDAKETVAKAESALKSFMDDENFAQMRKLAKSAKGILIAPNVIKGALVIGASGGTGVFLVRGGNGKWSYPAFYSIGSMSFGFQAGGQASEIILLAMTDRGVKTLLQNSVKLGADAGLAAGPYGVGAQAATENISADILSFSRSKGLYGGVSLDGAVVAVRDKLNKAYYGKALEPEDILVKSKASNPNADKLRASVAKLAGK
jgi:SH3 domain-containing YSC84-like protein 1